MCGRMLCLKEVGTKGRGGAVGGNASRVSPFIKCGTRRGTAPRRMPSDQGKKIIEITRDYFGCREGSGDVDKSPPLAP